MLNLELFHLPILIYCQLEYICIPILKLLINATSLLDYLYQNNLKATWYNLDRKYISKGSGVEGLVPRAIAGDGGSDSFRQAQGLL